MVTPFIIGVAGGSASGKKDVCTHILAELTKNHPKLKRCMAIVSLTSFYRDLTSEELILAQNGQFNHDHPDVVDWKLLDSFLSQVALGLPAQQPIFDFVKMKRTGFVDFPPTDVILFQGTLVLYKRKLRDRMNIRLFVDVDCDVRLSATVTRDTLGQYNRQVKPLVIVLDQWLQFVKPAFEDFVQPTKKYADVIIPRGFDNVIALDILIRHIDQILTSTTNVNPLSASSTPSCSVITSPKSGIPTVIEPLQIIQQGQSGDDEGSSSESDSPSTLTSPVKKSMLREFSSLAKGNIRSKFTEVPN